MKTYEADFKGKRVRVTIPPGDPHLDLQALTAVLRDKVTWFSSGGKRVRLGVAYPTVSHGGVAILCGWTPEHGDSGPSVELLDDLAAAQIRMARRHLPVTKDNADIHALAALCEKAVAWRDAQTNTEL